MKILKEKIINICANISANLDYILETGDDLELEMYPVAVYSYYRDFVDELLKLYNLNLKVFDIVIDIDGSDLTYPAKIAVLFKDNTKPIYININTESLKEDKYIDYIQEVFESAKNQ